MGLSLTEAGSNADLVCATDGEEAINYLNSVGSAELPSLIILDLNMPKWNGRQTLNYIKQQPHLAAIPVVILSTSENRVEQEACAILGASSYYKKPYHLEGYREIINNFLPLMHS
jgi:CheY-like chemotaxis protein